jgi:hypothetical protein
MKHNRRFSWWLWAFLVLTPGLAGCTALQYAQDASKGITIVLDIAKAEQGLVPAADQVGYSGFVSLAQSLDSQLKTCITAGGTTAALATCFNTFASGLASSAELAQLRILSPATQAKVQKYLTGVIIGANIYFDAVKKPALVPPAVGPAPTAAEMQGLREKVERGM